MKNVKTLVLTGLAMVSLQAKSQQNNFHKNYVEAGFLVGNQNSTSGLAGVYGAGGFFFKTFDKISSIDFRAKEVYLNKTETQATILTATYRLTLVRGLYIGLGAAHGHQIAFHDFETSPVSAIGGYNTHIIHSSGYNIEFGYSFNPLLKTTNLNLYPVVNFAFTQLNSAQYVYKTVSANFGLRLGFKQWNGNKN